jgi:hypothetical protein
VRVCALVFVAAALAVVLPGRACADGDPASDYLVSLDTFTGVQAPPSNASDLREAVARAFDAGYRVKVAVVPTRVDLGAIPSLFNKPKQYAKFLGLELRELYAGPLLIVMPGGFGIYDAGRSTAAEAEVLAAVRVRGRSVRELTSAATTAVKAMTRAGALRSRDIQAPLLYQQFVAAKPGEPVTLTYRVLEDSERSGETVTVYSGEDVLTTFQHPLAKALFSQARSFSWTAPQQLPPDLRWCVVGKDATGNTSKPACLSLRAGQ